MPVEPFQIEIPDADLDDLIRRLHQTRLLPPPADEPPESGVDRALLTRLLEYWRDGFDWRAREAYLAGFPQFRVEIDDVVLHVAHLAADRARYPAAIPIILGHGWPYSYLEFLEFSRRLVDPLAFGGTVDDVFDVVIPSLPGFGFSPPLDVPFTSDAVAGRLHRLMAELGYARYATYGEDVGTRISDWLGASYPESVIGLFTTHAAFPPEERTADLSPAEEEFRSWLAEKWKTASAYSAIQSTRPDTLAIGLTDSPAGLLAWILEKLAEWSGPGFAGSWSDDEILTLVCLYWFTGSIGTSFLPYFHDRLDPPIPLVEVPVGVAVQWGERGFPREYAERTYTDIRFWTDLPEGGHFTAKQSPDLVADAMREFFAGLR